MIAAIRIKGMVKNRKIVDNTLYRLRLRRKYSCIALTHPTKEQSAMIENMKDFVAFGEISDDLFTKLVEARGELIDKTKKTDLKKAAQEILSGKTYEEANIKPFFRLHPARGGIDAKKHFGVKKGVLGNHKDQLGKLMEKML